MKKTLWTFGDSFTQSYTDNSVEWVQLYCKWKGFTPKVYGEIISEKMDMKLKNLGVGGSDNYSIFQSVCDNISYIKPNDVVIIGWSAINRFRLVSKSNVWIPVMPGLNYEKNFEFVSQSSIEEIIVNRESTLYKDEVRSWINILNYAFPKNLLINWDWLSDGVAPNYFGNLMNIRRETNGLINDVHYSEEGHIQLANKLMYMISNGINKKLL
jgi:hypothetical protein